MGAALLILLCFGEAEVGEQAFVDLGLGFLTRLDVLLLGVVGLVLGLLALHALFELQQALFGGPNANLLLADNVALVDPDLDADAAIGRVGFARAVVDVGPQRVQRHLADDFALAARHLGATQAAGNHNLDALGA